MDKNAVLGEMLYILSNYEKGKIKTSGIWRKKYINSLKKSLEIMKIMVTLLRVNYTISAKEITPILNYYKENVGKIFPVSNVDIDNLYKTEKNFFQEDIIEQKNIVILDTMEDIIEQCEVLLSRKKRGYKLKLSYLLKAFHNLPKVFIDPTEKTLFNIGVQPVNCDDALSYAKLYIEKIT